MFLMACWTGVSTSATSDRGARQTGGVCEPSIEYCRYKKLTDMKSSEMNATCRTAPKPLLLHDFK